jgi:hypothetical protein
LFLLALYVFITMPVNLWHHHHTGSAATAKLIVQKNPSSNASANEAACDICTHQYGIQDFPVSQELLPMSENAVELVCFYQIKYQTVPRFSIDNKGPPALFAI